MRRRWSFPAGRAAARCAAAGAGSGLRPGGVAADGTGVVLSVTVLPVGLGPPSIRNSA